jgi:hypothetical protein
MKTKILLIIACTLILNHHLFSQINLANDDDNAYERLEEYIGENGAKFLSMALNYYVATKIIIKEGEYKKADSIYILLYDTLFNRDIVSHPHPFTQNNKWLNIYKSLYPHAFKLNQPRSKDFNEDSDSFYFSTLTALAIMPEPNQIVFVHMSPGKFWEATIEFSEMSYTSTLCQPFDKKFFNNPESPLYKKYQVSTLTIFYNAYRQIEMDVEVSIDGQIPLYEGSFVGHMRSDFIRFYNRQFRKEADAPFVEWRHSHCFCKGNKYCPIGQLIHKYYPGEYYSIFQMGMPYHYIPADSTVKDYFSPNVLMKSRYFGGKKAFPAIGPFALLPTGWHKTYDVYGNLNEKIFFASVFDKNSERINGPRVSELYSKYETIDGEVVKTEEAYLKFDEIMDSIKYMHKTDAGNIMVTSFVEDYIELFKNITRKSDDLKYEKLFDQYGLTKTSFYPDSLFIDSLLYSYSKHFWLDLSEIGDYIEYNDYWREFKKKKYSKLFYQKHNTIYRMHPEMLIELLWEERKKPGK